MNTTQQHLPIADIQDEILILKDGGGALILQTSAVNFGLLSEREQMAIIYAFAQMLNSLSFSIQIVVHSERLNISSYIQLLNRAQKSQTNPLLASMIGNYTEFIQQTIKENDVLDKKFYIVIPLFAIELGITASKESLNQKIKTILLPRRDQVIRQLHRTGLKAVQLTGEKLLELFYDLYSGLPTQPLPQEPLRLNRPGSTDQQTSTSVNQPVSEPASQPPPQNMQAPIQSAPTRNNPFVVEELPDDS